MKNLLAIIALALCFIGCGTIRESITKTKHDVDVVLPVKPVNDSTKSNVTDSTITGAKLTGKDTTAKITTRFVLADSVQKNMAKATVVKQQLKKALNDIAALPVQPVTDYYLKPDSARGKVTITERTIEKEKDLSWLDYLKIGCTFFVFGFLFGLWIKK
jgi:hypothetical protein